MIPQSRSIQGGQIGQYLPSLADAARWNNDAVGLRTSAQCQGTRENGEIFLAQMWFSSYLAPEGKRLAAIVVDSSEELRDREEQNLRHLLAGNRIATSAIAHEVRNFCEAMTMACNDLARRHELAGDETLRGLDNLVEGLEAIASMELKSPAKESVEDVSLKEILDNLRIVIEPAWREIEGSVRFLTPESVPSVWAEPHGLMQVFLNLAQNSHRAVQEGSLRELNIAVSSEGPKTFIQFRDSGPGVLSPERLFQLFQDGAAGSGLGLYVSRFIVRSYGGELRFLPQAHGSCFAIELPTV
jgi:signal transduction histidine kinase